MDRGIGNSKGSEGLLVLLAKGPSTLLALARPSATIYDTIVSGLHPCRWRVCYQRGLPCLVFTLLVTVTSFPAYMWGELD